MVVVGMIVTVLWRWVEQFVRACKFKIITLKIINLFSKLTTMMTSLWWYFHDVIVTTLNVISTKPN